jgi:hypothetical protein
MEALNFFSPCRRNGREPQTDISWSHGALAVVSRPPQRGRCGSSKPSVIDKFGRVENLWAEQEPLKNQWAGVCAGLNAYWDAFTSEAPQAKALHKPSVTF